MSTTFVLKGFDVMSAMNNTSDIQNMVTKSKFDIVKPGKVIHTNGAGGTVRVLQRGNLYDKDGNKYNRECNKLCWWHRGPIKGLAMGIPLRIKHEENELEVFVDGYFCSYSCVLAYLNEEMFKIPERRNSKYTNSKTLLVQLFSHEFPDEELVPARDWKLLKDVGNGNLTYQEWAIDLKGLRLVEHPNIMFTSVTMTYGILNEK